jgi:hypothetical protein
MKRSLTVALALSLVTAVTAGGGLVRVPIVHTAAALIGPPAPVLASGLRQAAPTFSTVLMHVERPETRIDAGNASLTQISAGQRVRIVMYVRVAGLTRPTQVGATLRIQGGGKLLFYSTGTFTVSRATLGGFSNGWLWFQNRVPPCGGGLRPRICLPPVPGRYTVSGIFGMGGRTGQAATTLIVG